MIFAITGQSLLDIAVQESGSALAAFDWAIVNGISITDDLTPGQKLVSAVSVFENQDILRYFKTKNQLMATALNKQINSNNTLGFPYGLPISF